MFVRNNSFHSATKLTPNDCLFGFTAKLPNNLKRDPQPVYDYENYFLYLRNKLQKAHRYARTNLINSKETSKKYYDKNVNPVTLQVGDKVLLRDGGRRHKLTPYWLGPFRVVEVNSPVNTTIQIGKRKRRIHNNRLKLFFENSSDST